jgi:flavorubredoxin
VETVDFGLVQFASLAPNGFITDIRKEIQRAAAIILVSSAVKENSTRLLASILKVLADHAFAKRPVVLVVTGAHSQEI